MPEDEPMPEDGTVSRMTVDELARRAGTSTRNIRTLQTLGILHRPRLVGRTGFYGPDHQERVRSILRLQQLGFSLSAIATLLDAHRAGLTLGQLLGLDDVGRPDQAEEPVYTTVDWPGRRSGGLVLVVPTTVLSEPMAS